MDRFRATFSLLLLAMAVVRACYRIKARGNTLEKVREKWAIPARIFLGGPFIVGGAALHILSSGPEAYEFLYERVLAMGRCCAPSHVLRLLAYDDRDGAFVGELADWIRRRGARSF